MKRVYTGKELGAALRLVRKNTEADFADILAKLAMDGYRMLVQRTAVDTGYARAKWSVSVDSTPSEEVQKGKSIKGRKPKSGAVYSTPNIPSFKIKAGSVVILYNNTEYIIYLEQGTARMRAQPMVQPTYEYLLGVANRLCSSLSKEGSNV